jgi:dihydrofolate synthase / folylpolyglutamate synthase
MRHTTHSDRYQAALDFLYAQLPMFHRVGASAYKKDLTNTLALCAHLGHPQRQFPSIHVGGTNGKGSVSHLLAAACQAAGLKTGLYISPHYHDFRERIKINGQYIPHECVADFVEQHRPQIEQIQPSFFELCVAMAFDHFARERVDIAIVEVGLGGRLDSTNVIEPLLSVITNISYDHMNLLGDTLTLIASEKAGIIKPNTPVVIGETHPESAPVFRAKAAEMNAPITFADQNIPLQKDSTVPSLSPTQVYRIQHPQVPFQHLETDVAGPFQEKNLATALQAAALLAAMPSFLSLTGKIDWWSAVQNAWKQVRILTRFQGRWQWIGKKPLVLADSAHNEAGLRSVFEAVADYPHRQLHLVTGFVNDKDREKVLPLFPTAARYYFAKADIPRGLPAEQLRSEAAQFGLQGRAYRSVRHALRAARRHAHPTDDLILVVGSIFVVGEILPKTKG